MEESSGAKGNGVATERAREDVRVAERRRLAAELERDGIRDPAVLDAVRTVPRHRFVPIEFVRHAYVNRALSIGHGQTISQPYVVAYMTEILRLGKETKVLEIGTGSGYQAAILAELAGEVYSIEIVPELAKRADALLTELGYRNVRVRAGDGFEGWPAHAPFQAIVVTAAAPRVPPPLLAQLAPGGRLVIPLGDKDGWDQRISLSTKSAKGRVSRVRTLPVRFVPMTGRVQQE